MIHLSIQSDVAAATASLNDAAKKQIPFAIARALTALAFEAQTAERAHTKAVFKKPRPFTQRGTLVTKATKSVPVATVYLRPEVDRYLAPFETGGSHVLPGAALLNPKNVKLDRYGQLPQNAAKEMLSQPGVFAGTVTFKKSGKTVTGIWRRPAPGQQKGSAKTGLELLIRLGSALPVKQSLGFVATAQEVVAKRARLVFDAELTKALATART